MTLPTLQQYNEAVQNPAYAFSDPELRHGKVRSNGLGLPLAACGGVALTYTISNDANKYAVRCFHKEARDREKRYAAISRKLSALKSGYFVNFKFQKNGITIQGQPYPIVKMSWAGGETLGEFVNANFRRKKPLLALKQSLNNLALYLEKHGISHGDIQPGNVMVSNDGKDVQLIDYDGMYLPEIAGLASVETGMRNFQHPERESLNPWNERTDRFSFILLSIALDALSLDPQLWIKSQSDSDKFLIGANDFVDPDSSKIFTEMAALPSMENNMRRFSAICLGNYDAIPSLTDYLNANFQIQITSPSAYQKIGYISPYPVLDATNYDLCLRHVGDMVELIGKVVDVRLGKTKNNKPYVFLNFSDWKGNAVKISIWSEYLDKISDVDFRKFKDKFISVIGLMQPPYHGKTYTAEYTHLSINLDTTINQIDEHEAKYRLDYEKNPIPLRKRNDVKTRAKNRKNKDKPESEYGAKRNKDKLSPVEKSEKQVYAKNRNILDNLKNDASSGNVSARQSINHGVVSSGAKRRGGNNQDILNRIRNGSLSGSPTAGTPQKDVFAPCPYCQRLNNVGTSGVVIQQCWMCDGEFEYSHYTKLAKRLNQSTPKQRPGQTKNSCGSSTPQTAQKTDKAGCAALVLLIAFFLILISCFIN